MLGGHAGEKIFLTLAGAFVYVYLFASVPGTFELQFELLHDHPGLSLALGAGAVVLIVVLVRIFRRKLPGLIERASRAARSSAPSRLPGACRPAVLRRVAGQARRDRRVLAGYGSPSTFHR